MMSSEVKYFDTLDEVRKFLGTAYYDVLFGHLLTKEIFEFIEPGLVIAKDGMPAIHYSNGQRPIEVISTILDNAEIRHQLTGNTLDSCIKGELIRAKAMDIAGLHNTQFGNLLKQ